MACVLRRKPQDTCVSTAEGERHEVAQAVSKARRDLRKTCDESLLSMIFSAPKQAVSILRCFVFRIFHKESTFHTHCI